MNAPSAGSAGARAKRWLPDPRVLARNLAAVAATLAAALLVRNSAAGLAAVSGFLGREPYVLPGAAVLLALAFRRSRAFYAVLVVTIAARSLDRLAADPGLDLQPGRLAFHAAALLLPLDLALIAQWRERGLANPVGLARLALLAVQPLLVAWLWLAYLPGGMAAFERPLTRSARFASGGLAEPAVLSFAVAAAVLLLVIVRRAESIDAALAGALAASFAALLDDPGGPASALWFGAAAASVVAGLIAGASSSALRDPLTGLPGRRAFDEELGRLGRRWAVALVDVDHFKRFNDSWGHEAGDQALRLVASRLARVGGGGRAFRHGGEEFAVLFPRRGCEAAEPHLETVRAAIAAAGFTVRGADRPRHKPRTVPRRSEPRPHVTVTVSIGVAERDARHDDAQAVVAVADAALYRAKAAGRNRLSR